MCWSTVVYIQLAIDYNCREYRKMCGKNKIGVEIPSVFACTGCSNGRRKLYICPSANIESDPVAVEMENVFRVPPNATVFDVFAFSETSVPHNNMRDDFVNPLVLYRNIYLYIDVSKWVFCCSRRRWFFFCWFFISLSHGGPAAEMRIRLERKSVFRRKKKSQFGLAAVYYITRTRTPGNAR